MAKTHIQFKHVGEECYVSDESHKLYAQTGELVGLSMMGTLYVRIDGNNVGFTDKQIALLSDIEIETT